MRAAFSELPWTRREKSDSRPLQVEDIVRCEREFRKSERQDYTGLEQMCLLLEVPVLHGLVKLWRRICSDYRHSKRETRQAVPAGVNITSSFDLQL